MSSLNVWNSTVAVSAILGMATMPFVAYGQAPKPASQAKRTTEPLQIRFENRYTKTATSLKILAPTGLQNTRNVLKVPLEPNKQVVLTLGADFPGCNFSFESTMADNEVIKADTLDFCAIAATDGALFIRAKQPATPPKVDPAKPGSPAKPAAPTKPGDAAKPSAPAKPAAPAGKSNKPDKPTKPGAPAKSGPAKPNAPGKSKPSKPSKPDAGKSSPAKSSPSKPSKPNKPAANKPKPEKIKPKPTTPKQKPKPAPKPKAQPSKPASGNSSSPAQSAPAPTEALRFSIENLSEYTIVALYIVSEEQPDWETDILDDYVGGGETVNVLVDDQLPGCNYDLRIEYDGQDALEVTGFDLCAVSRAGETLSVGNNDEGGPEEEEPAEASELYFSVENNSSYDINAVYIVSTDEEGWEAEVLGGVIASGEVGDVGIEDVLPGCNYTVVVEYDGQDSLEVPGLDLCAISDNQEVLTVGNGMDEEPAATEEEEYEEEEDEDDYEDEEEEEEYEEEEEEEEYEEEYEEEEEEEYEEEEPE
jgi:hypothetical protein